MMSDHAAALQAERDKHAAEIKAKDAEIERLRETATSRGRCIEDMQHTIARRDAAIERLRKDNSGLHEIQDLQREHIVERDRRIAGLEKELAEARALADQQYKIALQTVKENEALKAALEGKA